MQINSYLYTNTLSQEIRKIDLSSNKNNMQPQTSQPMEISKPPKDYEMEIFKKEIYSELAYIGTMASGKIISSSVHITADGLKKMKEDPAYRKNIMDSLRAKAMASHDLIHSRHETKTITTKGLSEFGLNVYNGDSPSIKSSKNQWANMEAKGAFYHSKRKLQNIDNTTHEEVKPYQITFEKNIADNIFKQGIINQYKTESINATYNWLI